MNSSFKHSKYSFFEIAGLKNNQDLEELEYLLITSGNKKHPTFIATYSMPINFVNRFVESFFSKVNNKSYISCTDYYSVFDEMTISNFLKELLTFNIVNEKNAKYIDKKNFLDDYIFKDDRDSLKYLIESAYKSMINLYSQIVLFSEGKKDGDYFFSQNKGNQNFPIIAKNIKERIFDKLYLYDDFENEIIKVIDEFKESKTKKIPLYKFEVTKKIYIIEKTISIDEILKTPQIPKITELSLVAVKMKTINDYQYIFREDKDNIDKSVFSVYENYDLVINSQQNYEHNGYVKKQTQNCLFEFSRDVFIFDSKEDAESFFRNQLKEIRSQIDEILQEVVVF